MDEKNSNLLPEEYNFDALVSRQRAYYKSGQTRDISFRIAHLRKLYQALKDHQQEVIDAVHKDFRKPEFEAYATEIALVLDDIKFMIRRLPRLMRKKRVKSNLASWPAKSCILYEPYGVTLIIGAWNYPILLVLLPLVGAIAAGNTCIIKPSELSSHTSAAIKKILESVFNEEYLVVLEGGPAVTSNLLGQKLDYIFFTGSPRVGKIVMQAAAKHLTPFTLELGGKSPCVVDEDANLNRAADRIIWGKLVNAGQTCVAPDYLYVHEKVKKAFVDEIKVKIRKNYGDNPKNSPDYARIINKKHFKRLRNLISGSKVLIGGDTDPEEMYIAPTLVDEVNWSNPLMQEEIFGPVLPILTFKNLDDVIRQINDQPKPLALYYFSSSKKKQQRIMKELSFGGGCINDTLLQFSNSELPVGGVGNSGVGQYHGEESFYTFSHKKSIVNKGTWIDVPLRYPPYEGKLKWLKLLFRH